MTRTLADILYPEPAPPLSEADRAHDTAREIYHARIVEKARQAGSVASLAAACKIPATTIHSVLDRRQIKTLRSLAHEIERKFKVKHV